MKENPRIYELDSEVNGYFYTRKGTTPWTVTPHFHSSIELLFCMDGEQEIAVSGEKKILKKGQACFIDSYAVHSLQESQGNLYVFLGDMQFFQPVFHAFGDKIPPTFFPFKNEALLLFLHELCKEPQVNCNTRKERNEGAIKILLSEIAKNVLFVSRRENRQTDLIASILQYASENLQENLSLTEIANKFGYSTEHLSRVLNKHLGERWNLYVGRLRVRTAETLLKNNPVLSVLEIATQCGFDSPNTFYRAYKREYGKPPRR